MASVKFILRTDKTDNNGYCPIYIILIKDRKKKYVSTGIKAKESQWDDEQKKVRKNFPNSARTNALLLQKLADASGTVADMERKSKSVSARKLKEAVKGKGAQNYFAYAEDRCEKIKGTVSARTYKAYKSSLKKFEECLTDGSFCRVHRSYIVSLPQINYIERKRIKIGNDLIPISESYMPAFLDRLSLQE